MQQGTLLIVNGSHLAPSSEVVIDGKTLGATVISAQQLSVMITTSLISAPGSAKVTVRTPGGISGDLGCSSGGDTGAAGLDHRLMLDELGISTEPDRFSPIRQQFEAAIAM